MAKWCPNPSVCRLPKTSSIVAWPGGAARRESGRNPGTVRHGTARTTSRVRLGSGSREFGSGSGQARVSSRVSQDHAGDTSPSISWKGEKRACLSGKTCFPKNLLRILEKIPKCFLGKTISPPLKGQRGGATLVASFQCVRTCPKSSS